MCLGLLPTLLVPAPSLGSGVWAVRLEKCVCLTKSHPSMLGRPWWLQERGGQKRPGTRELFSLFFPPPYPGLPPGVGETGWVITLGCANPSRWEEQPAKEGKARGQWACLSVCYNQGPLFLPALPPPSSLACPQEAAGEGFQLPAGFSEDSCSPFLQHSLHLSKQRWRVLNPDLLFSSCRGQRGLKTPIFSAWSCLAVIWAPAPGWSFQGGFCFANSQF